MLRRNLFDVTVKYFLCKMILKNDFPNIKNGIQNHVGLLHILAQECLEKLKTSNELQYKFTSFTRNGT